MEDIIPIIGIGAVMMIAPIAIGITLIYSYEATKNIGLTQTPSETLDAQHD